MKHIISLILIISSLGLSSCGSKQNEQYIDLSGTWQVALDPTDVGEKDAWFTKPLAEAQAINLPSTLEEAKIGDPVEQKTGLNEDNLYELSRQYSYIGAAWYQREIDIPANYAGKGLTLTMERVLWKSTVWVDGVQLGTANSLVAAHRIDLGELSKGKHVVTICIDNRQQYDLFDDERPRSLAHAYTETTQTKWNGILGDFKIEVTNPMKDVAIYPDFDKQEVVVSAVVKEAKELFIEIQTAGGEVVAEHKENVAAGEFMVKLKGDFEPWDEFSPQLYTVVIKDKANQILSQETFGMRQIKTKANQILLNNSPIFLRGTLECATFPLLGHPPTDKKSWVKVFSSAEDYGMNHIRFHSWCPPKAAFEVADSLGVYIQVEMPNWSLKYGEDSEMVAWMESEGRRMIKEYGNHPSFCFMSLGNELVGDYDLLSGFLQELKASDNRHLYTTTSFTFQKPYTSEPVKGDDFWITQWTKDGWVRGQGVFDQQSPTFNKSYQASVDFLDIPLITHEIGQYSIYPNLEEISKYTGVLAPNNFKAIKEDLVKKGRYDKAKDYLMASGTFAKILYKEEIERALKTPSISGFQLLGLNDFPGQGTALVGVVDAFWDSKGILTGDEYRRFCSELVPLVDFEKATYTSDETFTAKARVANYWKDIISPVFEWTIKSGEKLVASGELKVDFIEKGNVENLGDITLDLSKITRPEKLDITLALKGDNYSNDWSIWAYPAQQDVDKKQVVIATTWGAAKSSLEKGAKVLFTPNIAEVKGLEGKFVPVFWSPVHFPNQPGTMGLLVNDSHPVFANFPTDYHSDWQWWDLCKHSKTIETADLNTKNLVEVVDNFFKNRELSNLFEAKVGKGTLVFSSMDLHSNLQNRYVAKALRNSIINYMNSADFAPSNKVTYQEIEQHFKQKAGADNKEKKGIYD